MATGGNTATKVSTGKPKVTGAVYVAPRTATIPTDATSALDDAFVCLGHVSEDGLENDNEMDISTIKAWGGVIVYRSLTELNDLFKLALIESKNIDVLKAVYGDSNVTVDASGNISVNVKAEDPQEKIWVFELALRGNLAKRIVVPDGAITSRESITYNDEDPIEYGIEVSAYPDANGNTHKEYIEGESGATYYTVSFDVDGGSAVPSQTVAGGSRAMRPTNPTKEDYEFDGWYADSGFTTEFDWYSPINANTTVYAKWRS